MLIDTETRIDGAASVGERETSMLQDFEHGRAIALGHRGTVAELGEIVGVDTPMVDAIYALARRNRVAVGILRSVSQRESAVISTGIKVIFWEHLPCLLRCTI